jgi:hypothetical protein
MTADRLTQPGTVFDPWLPRRARVVIAIAGLSVLVSAPPVIRGIAAAVTLVFFLRGPVTAAAAARARRRYRGRFVDPASLDSPSRQLLQRAQAAIAAVLSSAVHQAGQLDDAANVAVLSAHEWDIAQLLSDASRLRAEHVRITAAAPREAPDVAAMAQPQKEILVQVGRAVTARVEAIEAYASRVRDADDAYRSWQQSLGLAGLNDRFLDLLARTAADRQASDQITGLAGQARIAEQEFRGTLLDARTAADPIALSAANAPAGPAPRRQAAG